MPARAPTVKKMMPHTHRTASEGRNLVNSTLTLARLPPSLPLTPLKSVHICPFTGRLSPGYLQAMPGLLGFPLLTSYHLLHPPLHREILED